MSFYNSFVQALSLFITIILFIPLTIITSLVWLIALPIDPKRKAVHAMLTAWATIYTAAIPTWKMSVHGRQHLKKKNPYIFIANHQSPIDILMMYHINWRFKWVAKKELFSTPLFGMLLRMGNYISIQRSSPIDAQKMITQAAQCLNEGISIAIFPEGTRSRSGSVLKFKSGAFALALQAKATIVPIVIQNANRALRNNRFPTRRTSISLHILEPIPYNLYHHLNTQQLTLHVQEIIRTKHHQLDPESYDSENSSTKSTPRKNA